MPLHRTAASLLLLAWAHACVAHAQDYPTRPIRIVTATPGGGNDYLARIIAPALEGAIGQQVIVDNRPSRFVGGLVARATPDGYTLVVGGGTMQFLPLTEKTDYDVLTDFAPISQLERSPNTRRRVAADSQLTIVALEVRSPHLTTSFVCECA